MLLFDCFVAKLRALYIVVMNALKDVETQKRGFVAVAYNVGRDHTKGKTASNRGKNYPFLCIPAIVVSHIILSLFHRG